MLFFIFIYLPCTYTQNNYYSVFTKIIVISTPATATILQLVVGLTKGGSRGEISLMHVQACRLC
jgi:hypothetical protein